MKICVIRGKERECPNFCPNISFNALDLYAFCAYNQDVNYQWDPHKAAVNVKKHGVEFADAVGVFEDEFALWQETIGDHDEERFQPS